MDGLGFRGRAVPDHEGQSPLFFSRFNLSCLKGLLTEEGGVAFLDRGVLRLDLRILAFYLPLACGGARALILSEGSCLLFATQSRLDCGPGDWVFSAAPGSLGEAFILTRQ